MQALWAFDMPDAASATTDNTQEASAEQDIFPANRIIVSLEDGVGLYGDDHDNVVSSDENTYILEYGDVDEAQDAYLRYDGADGVSFAAADVVLEAADDGTAEIPAEAPAAVL